MANLRVAVNGATGKMGREVIAALSREPDMEPVGAVCLQDRGASLDLPDGAGAIPQSTSLEDILKNTSPDVLVDFTHAEASMAASRIAAGRGTQLVVGTTGLSEEDIEELGPAVSRAGHRHHSGPQLRPGRRAPHAPCQTGCSFFRVRRDNRVPPRNKIDARPVPHLPWRGQWPKAGSSS